MLLHFAVPLVANADDWKDGCLDMNAAHAGKADKARRETKVAVVVVDIIRTYNVRAIDCVNFQRIQHPRENTACHRGWN